MTRPRFSTELWCRNPTGPVTQDQRQPFCTSVTIERPTQKQSTSFPWSAPAAAAGPQTRTLTNLPLQGIERRLGLLLLPARSEEVGSPPARRPVVAVDLSDAEDSDEYNFEEESESVAREPESDLESTASGRKKLPRNLQQQLALDIHARGGIALFNLENKQGLCDLCDQRPELYGDRGDDLRKPIQKKVQRWRELSPSGYLLALKNIGIKFTGGEPVIIDIDIDSEKKPRAKPAPAPKPAPTSSAPTSRPQSPSIPASVSVPSGRSVESNASIVASINSLASNGTKMSTFQNTTRITVNPAMPECNGPFLIYPVPDFTGASGDQEYKGYYIMYRIDNRFVEMDDSTNWITGWVHSNGHCVIIKVPAWPFPLWPKGKHHQFLYNQICSQVGDRVAKSMHNAHSVFDDQQDGMGDNAGAVEARKWKYYELDFSKCADFEGALSSRKLYNEAGENETLDYDLITVPFNWKVNGNDIEVLQDEDYLGFKVANVVGDGRKTKRTGAGISKMAQKRANKKAAMKQDTKMATESSIASVPKVAKKNPKPTIKVESSGVGNSNRIIKVGPVASDGPKPEAATSGGPMVDEDLMNKKMSEATEDDDAMSATDLGKEANDDDDDFMQNLDDQINELKGGLKAMEEGNPMKRTRDNANEEVKSEEVKKGWLKSQFGM